MSIIHFFKNLGGIISKNSTTILTGIAVVGVPTTVIFAMRATPKALALIDDEIYSRYEASGSTESFPRWLGLDTDSYTLNDRVNVLSKMETFKLTWKCYVPTAATGLITIGCILGASYISSKRNALLENMYGIAVAASKEYQAKVIETLGSKKELAIRDEISKDRINANPPGTNEIVVVGQGQVLCYDSLSGRYFRSDMETIRRAVNTMNQRLINETYISLNEFYDELGLRGTVLGEELGWDINKGYLTVDFSAQITPDTNEPCIVLNYQAYPRFLRED